MKQTPIHGPSSVAAELNPLGQPVGFAMPNWKPLSRPGKQPLEGRLCRIEALDAERHAEALWNANSLDREGRNWTYLYGPFTSLDEYRSWMVKVSGDTDTEFYAIVERKTGSALGVASYLNIDENNGSIEVGHLAFSPLLQRKTQATEAMFLMMERAFSLGYRRYVWKCDALNAPSRSAALRLGFMFEGTFRQAIIHKGRNRDTAWFSIIDQEWLPLRVAFTEWLHPTNFDDAGNQRRRLTRLIELAR